MFLISIRNEMSCGLKMDEREANRVIAADSTVAHGEQDRNRPVEWLVAFAP